MLQGNITAEVVEIEDDGPGFLIRITDVVTGEPLAETLVTREDFTSLVAWFGRALKVIDAARAN